MFGIVVRHYNFYSEMACAAYGCNSRRYLNKDNDLTFHRFPKDPNRRMQWLLAARRGNWVPSDSSTLCSKHFPEEMFDRCSTLRVALHPNAVPTIFEGHPSHIKQELRSLAPKPELKTLQSLPVKQKPFEEISNNTDVQTELCGDSDKNRILTVPGDLDIPSTFSSHNGNSSVQNHVLIISDDSDIKKILNNGDFRDQNRVIIVSDGTNMQNEWCSNIGEDSLLNVTLDDPIIKIESSNNSIADSSFINSLLLHDEEYYLNKIKQLEEKMTKLQKKLKLLHQTSRRRKERIIRLWKEVSRLKRNSQQPPCRAQPIVHLMDCGR